MGDLYQLNMGVSQISEDTNKSNQILIFGYYWNTRVQVEDFFKKKKKTRTDKLNPLESQNNTGISFAFFWLRMWRNIYHINKWTKQRNEIKPTNNFIHVRNQHIDCPASTQDEETHKDFNLKDSGKKKLDWVSLSV